MKRVLILGFILISCFAKAQSWTNDSYSRYNEVTFYKVEALYNLIDFKRVDIKLLQAAIFYVTNEERKKAKLKTFNYNSKIENIAAGHAQDMVKYNFYSHTSQIRIKRTVQDRFHLEGLNPKFYGENICSTYGLQYQNGRKVNPPYRPGEFTYAFTSKKEVIPPHTYISFAKEVLRLWMESPGHRQNILNPKFTSLGCGASIYFDKNFYNMPYLKVVQNFGSD
ncbi:CAP domain-containing protein [Algoriphagus boritolerans]|uniref:Cysteine-rich secretory protein family protein n=1 Tax=Algoriphagus boritolerans DSM 17298 = JCM 18970 TaxID=1120964 RepID=A0A1H5TLH2_9BACT|nr:CAP domain-containing protein [Algoriphagus boritolerans]SEF63614.1 Cysteine-rich secretory protein family protein [Algoriphagus boritolerans DSM 17298 = JCM 18970]